VRVIQKYKLKVGSAQIPMQVPARAELRQDVPARSKRQAHGRGTGQQQNEPEKRKVRTMRAARAQFCPRRWWIGGVNVDPCVKPRRQHAPSRAQRGRTAAEAFVGPWMTLSSHGTRTARLHAQILSKPDAGRSAARVQVEAAAEARGGRLPSVVLCGLGKSEEGA